MKPVSWKRQRLGDQMLAAAETDLDPHLLNRLAEQRRGV